MQIFNKNSGQLEQIKEIGFTLEKDMQKLTEDNMDNIFGLEFIKTEFQLNNLRIDSLAFDVESNSFVIIEYKRGNSYSVIDQGMSYLALMLNNKADFVQVLGEKRNSFIHAKSIDWSQSKVIIIADSFNRYQKESINFKDLAIDLWELKQFNDGTIVFNPIKASNTTESIKTVTKFETGEFEKVNKEIKTYDENFHLKGTNDNIIEIYNDLKNYILNLDSNIEIIYKKVYIAFKLNKKNLVDIGIGKGVIRLWLNLKKGELKDINNIMEDVSNKGHHGNGDYGVKIINKNNIFDIKDLIKQTYDFYNN